MPNRPELPWWQRPQPDGSMAIYWPQRRSFVLLTKDQFDEMQGAKFRSLLICLLLYAGAGVLWLFWLKAHVRIEVAIIGSVAALTLAIITERWIRRPSMDIIMRAPLSTEPVQRMTLQTLRRFILSLFDDRRLRKAIIILYIVVLGPAATFVLQALGVGDREIPDSAWAYFALWPFMAYALFALRREKARRASALSQTLPEIVS